MRPQVHRPPGSSFGGPGTGFGGPGSGFGGPGSGIGGPGAGFGGPGAGFGGPGAGFGGPGAGFGGPGAGFGGPGAGFGGPGAGFGGPGAGFGGPGAGFGGPGAGFGGPCAGFGGPGSGFGQQPRPHAPLWMTRPSPLPNCPPGLEYLTLLDNLYVHQQVEMFEVMTGFDMPNRYQVLNANGEQLFFAGEDSDFMNRACLQASRNFQIHVFDNTGLEVIRILKPYGEAACCCCCCLSRMTVEAPAGHIIGRIQQVWAGYIPKMRLEDGNGNAIFIIVGPAITQSMCPGQNVEFDVCTKDEAHSVGIIAKQWSGFEKEYFTKADNFGISFPKDLHVNMKAVLLGACFLIDFMFFENKTPHQSEMERRRES